MRVLACVALPKETVVMQPAERVVRRPRVRWSMSHCQTKLSCCTSWAVVRRTQVHEPTSLAQ